MTDLRRALHDIAQDAPDVDDLRRRLRAPQRRFTPLLLAASVVAALIVSAGAALLLTHPRAATPGSNSGTPITPLSVAPSNLGTDVPGTPSTTYSGSAGPVIPVTAAPNQPWAATCFGEASLSTDLRLGVGMGQKVGAANTAPRPEDYFDICGAHWQTGTWTPDTALNPDYSAPPAPSNLQLVGCVLPDGSYGIFPGTDATCAALSLPVAIAPDPGVGVIETAVPTT